MKPPGLSATVPARFARGGSRSRRIAYPRRGARVVERGGLENRYARKGIGGSNPSPSATQSDELVSVSLAALYCLDTPEAWPMT